MNTKNVWLMDLTTFLLDICGHFILTAQSEPVLKTTKVVAFRKTQTFSSEFVFLLSQRPSPWRGLNISLGFVQLKFKIVSSFTQT